MDCLEYMRGLPDKYFDLCIADPPYGINAAKMTMGNGKNKQWTKKGWDSSIPSDDVFHEILRVSKNSIIWGGNYFNLPQSRAWIVWDKGIDGSSSFADGELAWTNFDRVLRIAKVRYQGFLGSDTCRIHPTQKPVALYAWLLDKYSIVGGVRFSTRSLVVGHRASRRTRKGLISMRVRLMRTTSRRRRNDSNVSVWV